MPLGFVEVDYYITTDNGKTPVRGVQIGRFAVRNGGDDDIARVALPPSDLAPWVVEHIPTGLALVAFDNFEDAYAAADDLSRFSKSDPSSKDQKRAVEQVGPLIRAWVHTMLDPWRGQQQPLKYIPYREWLVDNKGTLWKPKRRKMKSLFSN